MKAEYLQDWLSKAVLTLEPNWPETNALLSKPPQ